MVQSRMKIEQIKFTVADGIENLITINACDDSHYMILCVPAMGVAAKQYNLLLQELVNCGFTSACYDLRGNGNSSIRANRINNFGYAQLAEEDLPKAIECLLEYYPNKKLVLLGHSLGGQICSLYISQNPGIVDQLVLAASCSVYYKNWPSTYRWGLLFFAQFSSLISAILGHFPGRTLGFGGREARNIMKDWAYNARTGDYKLCNSRFNYLPFPSVPNLDVLAINFSDDQLAPNKATDHLLSKLSANNISKIQVSGDDIGRIKATHFNWLRSPEYVAKIIAGYLN